MNSGQWNAEVQNITHIFNSTCDGNSLYLGGWPCVNSSAVMPKLQMSAEESYCLRWITSGAIQQGCRTRQMIVWHYRQETIKFTYSANEWFSFPHARPRRNLVEGCRALGVATPQLSRKKIGLRDRRGCRARNFWRLFGEISCHSKIS